LSKFGPGKFLGYSPENVFGKSVGPLVLVLLLVLVVENSPEIEDEEEEDENDWLWARSPSLLQGERAGERGPFPVTVQGAKARSRPGGLLIKNDAFNEDCD
jgi:hypothetical protein